MENIKVVKERVIMGVEVKELSNNTLQFEKDGEEVIIPMEIGKDNYRLVRQELLRKGNKRSNEFKNVGQYSYKIDEDYMVTIYNVDNEVLFADVVDESELSYPRNFVINWILNNTK